MEEFIKQHAERLLVFKKNIFKPAHANDFIRKLCLRGDIKSMELELTKCLINTSVTSEKAIFERKTFIAEFISGYTKLQSDIEESKENEESLEQQSKTIHEEPDEKDAQKRKKDFCWGDFRMKNKDENFPSLDSTELINRKKKFVVLDRHYKNKLESGNKECHCMSLKHPLVSNCIKCGRIHCLQEGDKVCINCGNKLLSKDEYLKNIIEDNNAKLAYGHKEKLLKFQVDFYSKLQIIDDFNDWYEISNNTWINEEERSYAKKKDEENVWNEESA